MLLFSPHDFLYYLCLRAKDLNQDVRGDMLEVELAVATGADVDRFDEDYWYTTEPEDTTSGVMSQYNMLLWAAHSGHVLALHKLLTSGADPNVRAKESGDTPLLLASERGDNTAVKLLLQYGADPNIRSAASRSCIQMASAYGHERVCAMLLRGGASDHEGSAWWVHERQMKRKWQQNHDEYQIRKAQDKV